MGKPQLPAGELGKIDVKRLATGRYRARWDIPKVSHMCRVKFYQGRSGRPSRRLGGTVCCDRARDRLDSSRPGNWCRGPRSSWQRVGTWKQQATGAPKNERCESEQDDCY
jgi:hypothetical protein